MTHEDHQARGTGFSRRTALKAAAWSVPVVAAATAVPAHAASGDRIHVAPQGGQGTYGYNADRTRVFSQFLPSLILTVDGVEPVPAGAIMTLTWDNRLADDLGPTVNGAPLTAASTSSNGNATTKTYALPAAIPVSADTNAGLEIDLTHGLTEVAFYPENEDLVDYVARFDPPAGHIAASGSDIETAHYEDTFDAVVTDSTWRAVTIREAGVATPYPFPESITVRSAGPAPIPARRRVSVYVDSRVATPPALRNVTATLNGSPISSDLIELTSQGDGFHGIIVDSAIPVGQVLVVSWEVAAAENVAVESSWSAQAEIQDGGVRESNHDNNSAQRP